MASFGNKIKAVRKKAGLTQRALAKRAGVSNTIIYQIEKGTRNPGLKTLEKLSKALGVSFEALRGSKAKQNPSQGILDGLSYNQFIEWCMTNPEKMRGVSEHFDDKLVYEIASTVKPMVIQEKEQVLAFAKFLRDKK